MSERVTLEATVVAHTKRAYDAFTARDGSTVAGGTTHLLWVVKAVDEAPVSLKCSAEQYADAVAAGFGAQLKGEVFLRAQGNNIQRTLAREGVSIIGLG